MVIYVTWPSRGLVDVTDVHGLVLTRVFLPEPLKPAFQFRIGALLPKLAGLSRVKRDAGAASLFPPRDVAEFFAGLV